MRNNKGFTLIEVLIALAIASVAIIALMKTSSQTSDNIHYFKIKTLANIVSSNLAIEIRLSERPKAGYKDKEYKMAGITWQYRAHTTYSFPGISKTHISVYVNKSDKGNKMASSEIFVYLDNKKIKSKKNAAKTP